MVARPRAVAPDNNGHAAPDFRAAGQATPVRRALGTLAVLFVASPAYAGVAPAPTPATEAPLAVSEKLRLRLPPPEHVFEVPEDMGPSTLDVSAYPEEHQKAYREIFLPVYSILRGGPKRAINSALTTSDEWKAEVMKIKSRPPCCGACPNLSMDQARALWKFLAYDSLRRKTGPQAQAWARHRRKLIEDFKARRQ